MHHDIDALVANISQRIRPLVPEMPQLAFDEMVRHMAQVELKFRDRPGGGYLRTPPIGAPTVTPPN